MRIKTLIQTRTWGILLTGWSDVSHDKFPGSDEKNIIATVREILENLKRS
jgi:hypothetical protein